MPTLQQRISAQLGNPRSARISTLLVWSRWHLDSADAGIRLNNYSRPFGDSNPLGVKLQTIEFAAQNLVFRCVTTALDLCAAILFRVNHDSPSRKREMDVNEWFRKSNAKSLAKLPSPHRKWLEETRASVEWADLRECRDAITHRTLGRDLTVVLGGVPASKVQLDVLGVPHDIDLLMPRLLVFGNDRRSAFLTLLEKTF